mmetsp:Transcript_23619/g.42050  ORF Transcript_23619/g.42050 Transcript_23619/m.42050 type:complete len:291 (-) Transcript_23619:489-1361(-)
MSRLYQVSFNKQHGGYNRRYRHTSKELGCEMVFTVYFPPVANASKVPVVFYLSGLTCNDENFITKAGAQKYASELGVALIAPDTSPRGLGIDGESQSWDFGVGAGFYVNATEEKWKNWRMYDYISKELPSLLQEDTEFQDKLDMTRVSIMGHSMGGHGALVIALRNSSAFKSISAFSPICNPSRVPWGIKAFTGYLGEDQESWKQYDASELLRSLQGASLPLLVDVGSADSFLVGSVNQLRPEALEEAAKAIAYPLELRIQEGYDHSYYFISTFIEDHLRFHAKHLFAAA